MFNEHDFISLIDERIRKVMSPVLKLATIDPNYTSGEPKVIFDGETVPTGRTFKFSPSYTPKANDRVLVAIVGESALIVDTFGSVPASAAAFIPNWKPLTLANSYTNFTDAAWGAPSYEKKPDGEIIFMGLIATPAAAAANQIITTLPVGCRPKKQALLDTTCGDAWCRVDVYPDGTVRTGTGIKVSSWISLWPLKFHAEQ